jgi:alcohol dehydrogenase class IV
MAGPTAFTLALPRKIVFGWGRVREAPEHVIALGRRVLLVAGRRSQAATGALEGLVEALGAAGAAVLVRAGPGREPEVGDVRAAVDDSAPWRPDVVVGMGGGSTLDLAKALSAVLPNAAGHDVTDFLEGAAAPAPMERPPLPFVALPTTAGTGSEATRNAVISWPERRLKRSVRDERLVAAVAIVDPSLTLTAPPDVVAHAGMDAITQLVESFTSTRANPFTDALCLAALPPALAALPRVVRGGGGEQDRCDLSYAALASGICLANAGLGVAHGVAPALGILYGVPHGKACAVLLPFALEVNRAAARPKLAALGRACGLGAPGGGDEDDAVVGLLIDHVRGLAHTFGIPARLRDLGVTAEAIPELVKYASGNSLRANARPLTAAELEPLLAEVV